MRKTGMYLVVLVVMVYALFLLVQTEGIGTGGQPGGRMHAVRRHLVRISQLYPGQYASAQEYRTWAYSTCSTASMTETNYYGGSYRITDILAVRLGSGRSRLSLGCLRMLASRTRWCILDSKTPGATPDRLNRLWHLLGKGHL
jgi:hypothetical protein